MAKIQDIVLQINGKLTPDLVKAINTADGKLSKLEIKINSLKQTIGKTEQFAKLENALKNSAAQYSILRSNANKLSSEHKAAATHTKNLQNKLIGAQDSIGAYKTSLLSNRIELKNTNMDLRRLNTEMKASKSPSAELKAQQEGLTLKAAMLRRAIDQDTISMHNAKASLKPLGQEYKTAKNESSRLATQLESAEESTTSFQESTKNQKTALKALQSEFNISGTNTDAYREKQTKLQKQLHHSETALRQYQKLQGLQAKIKGWKTTALNTMNSAKKVASKIEKPVNRAISVESAMADVKQSVKFDSNDQFKQMKTDIIGLSKSIPMTTEELAKLAAFAGRAGIEKENLAEFAGTAAKMGIAFGISGDDAASMMASWRTSMKLSQSDVLDLADKISCLSGSTDISSAQISNIISNIGPLGNIGASASGEIAALGASMAGVGVDSETASAGIESIILGLTAGSSATAEQADAFAQLGLDASTMATKMQTDTKGAIMEVLTQIQGLDQAQQGNILENLFGSNSSAAITPLLSDLDSLQQNFDLIAEKSNYAGSMQTVFSAQTETTEAKLQLAKNAADAIAITIGDQLLPVVQKGAEWFVQIAEKVSAFAAEHPELVKWLTLGAAGITGLVMGLSGLSFIVLSVISPLVTMSSYLAKWGVLSKAQTTLTTILTGAQRAWNLAMSMNPIGLVVAGIVALVAIGYVLYENWNVVKDFMATLWDSPAANILLFLTGPIGWIIGAVAGIIANWDEVKAWFVTLWDNPSLAIDQFIQMIYEKFETVVNWINEKFGVLKDILGQPLTVTIHKLFSGDSDGTKEKEYASGGLITSPHLGLVGEAGPEMIIPLTRKSRGIALWQQAGQMLGLDASLSGGSVTASFAPQIHIAGNADAGTVQQIQLAMQESLADFERKLGALQNQKARVSYV